MKNIPNNYKGGAILVELLCWGKNPVACHCNVMIFYVNNWENIPGRDVYCWQDKRCNDVVFDVKTYSLINVYGFTETTCFIKQQPLHRYSLNSSTDPLNEITLKGKDSNLILYLNSAETFGREITGYLKMNDHISSLILITTFNHFLQVAIFAGSSDRGWNRIPDYLCSFYWNFTPLHTGGLPHSSMPFVSQHYLLWYPYTDIATNLFSFMGQVNLINLTTWYKYICRYVCVWRWWWVGVWGGWVCGVGGWWWGGGGGDTLFTVQ